MNGRRTGWTYDADGRVSTIDTRSYTYDAAGKTISFTGQRWSNPTNTYVPTSTTIGFDGDGWKVRETSDSSGSAITTYLLRSSILRGQIVTELNSSGQKQFGYVYTPAGSLIARQVPSQNYVMLKQSSPTGTSEYGFFRSNTGNGLDTRQEFDPLGANVRLNPGPVGHHGGAGDLPGSGGGPSDSRFGDFANPAAGCVTLLDGVPTLCDFVNRMGNGGGLQLRVGTTRYDIQLLGGSSTLWVDAWEEFYIPGKGAIGHDENGNDNSFLAGTTGIRNVGYFITIPGGATGLGTLGPAVLPQDPVSVPPLLDPRLIKTGHAFGDAATAMAQKKGPCKDFFTQGRSLQEVSDIFRHFRDSASYDPRMADIAGTTNSGQGMAATVRLGNAFFSDGPPVYAWSPVNNMYLEQTTNLTPRQYRALTVLHEFAHALGLIPRDGLKADPSGQQSERNNQTIYQKCGAILDALPLND